MDAVKICESLKDAGCTEEAVSEVLRLSESGKISDALLMIRKARCKAVEEMHECCRKVDRLDFLIRETMKEMKG